MVERFGERPGPEQLKGVAIDRACDAYPLCARLGREGNQVCAHYAGLHWAVDPFHIKGHTVGFN